MAKLDAQAAAGLAAEHGTPLVVVDQTSSGRTTCCSCGTAAVGGISPSKANLRRRSCAPCSSPRQLRTLASFPEFMLVYDFVKTRPGEGSGRIRVGQDV